MNIVGKRSDRGGGRVAVKLRKYVFDVVYDDGTKGTEVCYTLKTAATLKTPKAEHIIMSKLMQLTEVYAYCSIEEFVEFATIIE